MHLSRLACPHALDGDVGTAGGWLFGEIGTFLSGSEALGIEGLSTGAMIRVGPDKD